MKPESPAHQHGRGRNRIFDHGQMRLLALHLLGARPSHGYEIIHAVGELVGGDYSPSPGTVYPTLTLLEDMGWAASSALSDGRRQYHITPGGRQQLETQASEVTALLERLAHGRSRERARRTPDIERAMENLKTALRLRFGEGVPEAEALHHIADIIDQAAVAIGRV